MSEPQLKLNIWEKFAGEHPKAAKWIREGGLFVIVSNLITVMKYFILQGLPYAFENLKDVKFGWPGIPVSLFGVNFDWNIFGYAVKYNNAGQAIVGSNLGYFTAYMIAMAIGEIINFPIQKNFVFRSMSNLGRQIVWYVIAFIAIHCIVTPSTVCGWRWPGWSSPTLSTTKVLLRGE